MLYFFCVWKCIQENMNSKTTNRVYILARKKTKLQNKTKQNEINTTQKLGSPGAVDLKDAKIVVTNSDFGNTAADKLGAGRLDEIKDCEYDPTQHLRIHGNISSNLTFQRVYKETMLFIKDNNEYLDWPKQYLNSKRPKESTFSICEAKRRQMGNLLLDKTKQDPASDELNTIITRLFVNDTTLTKISDNYKLVEEDWFSKTFSFLKWQQDMITIVIHNLSHFRNESNNNEIENATSAKFGLMTLVHSYLNQINELLILFFSCFDKEYISLFYPFIVQAIGSSNCDLLFANCKHEVPSETKQQEQKEQQKQQQIPSLAMVALEIATKNDNDISKIEKQQNEILLQTKAVTNFIQSIFNVYDSSLEMETFEILSNNNNPFDLVSTIQLKLNEMINNIKTYVLVQQMNDIELNKYKNQHRDQKWHNRDDWGDSIDITYTNYVNNVITPSFIRLFVMRRILAKCDSLTEILNGISYQDKKQQEMVNSIVLRLVELGVKIYMAKYYHSDQKEAIELIMNKIIVKHFPKEYQQETNFFVESKQEAQTQGILSSVFSTIAQAAWGTGTSNNDNSNHFQEAVFNISDVMCQMFQNFEFSELINCSLVCSHWLYHTWNKNSLYHVDLTKLIHQTTKCGEKEKDMENNQVVKTWNRIVNAKSVSFSLFEDNATPNGLLLKKLSSLRNLEKINGDCWQDNISILKSIMVNGKNKIKRYDMSIWGTRDEKNVLSPLRLENANDIVIRNLYFYIWWSNKCNALRLLGLESSIGESWCNFVADYCDCSGIKLLELDSGVSFSFGSQNELSKRLLLTKLLKKFISLQQLKINFKEKCDANVLLLWQLLQPVIDKTNGNIELKASHKLSSSEYHKLNDAIETGNLKVDRMDVSIDANYNASDWEARFKYIQKRIIDSELKCLQIENCDINGTGFELLVNYLSNCNSNNDSSLRIIEMKDRQYSNIDGIIKVLQSSILIRRRIFVIGMFKIICSGIAKDFSSLFKTLCESIFSLLITEGIPIDIQFKFYRVKNKAKFIQHNKAIYLTYFDESKLTQAYNDDKVKCNKYCNALNQVEASFGRVDKDWDEYVVFTVRNALKSE